MDETILLQAVERVAADRGEIVLERTPCDSDYDNYSRYYDRVFRAFAELGGDKSPGYPLNLKYSTNSGWLKADKEFYIKVVIARLHLRLDKSIDFDLLVKSDLDAVRYGYVDPICVFIKNEPTPRRKFVDGSFRIISSVSALDGAVESVLYTEKSAILRQNLYWNGTATGIGFTDSQTKHLHDFVQIKTQEYWVEPTFVDFAGFESQHTQQAYEANALIDLKTVRHSRGTLSRWNYAGRNFCRLATCAISVMGGELYELVDKGGMNSGRKVTTVFNGSFCNTYCYYIGLKTGYKVDLAFANGDDGGVWTAAPLDVFLECGKNSGLRLRDVTRKASTFSYCSHTYREDGKASLDSWPKAMYKILTNPVLVEDDCLQVLSECRHNDNIDGLTRFVQSCINLQAETLEREAAKAAALL